MSIHQQPKESLPVGTQVRVNQGSGRFTLGVIHGTCDNTLCPGQAAYQIEITGGVDVFGKPASVGRVCRVNPSHCTAV